MAADAGPHAAPAAARAPVRQPPFWQRRLLLRALLSAVTAALTFAIVFDSSTFTGSKASAPDQPATEDLPHHSQAPPAAPHRSKEPSCILAIADLHGDLQQAHNALQLAGATNADGQWIAGSCVLVQTGDLVDRGDDSLAVVDLFEDLKAKAAAAGGEVVTLLGNHELESIQVRTMLAMVHANTATGLNKRCCALGSSR